MDKDLIRKFVEIETEVHNALESDYCKLRNLECGSDNEKLFEIVSKGNELKDMQMQLGVITLKLLIYETNSRNLQAL